MHAEAAGNPGPWQQQALLRRDRWDAEALRDLVRDSVVDHRADDDAVLVVDETGFLKQARRRAAQRGNTRDRPGKSPTARSAYSSPMSRAMARRSDRLLYLPKAWTDDPAGLHATAVPREIGFATKPQLASRMIARAIVAEVPFHWVTGGTVYGVPDIRYVPQVILTEKLRIYDAAKQ